MLIIAVTLALAFMLNPSAEKHREKIKDAVAERNQLAGALGIGSFTAMLSGYHSLGVASYTEVDDKLLSVGAFGVVMVKD
jgi:hypothetical protein